MNHYVKSSIVINLVRSAKAVALAAAVVGGAGVYAQAPMKDMSKMPMQDMKKMPMQDMSKMPMEKGDMGTSNYKEMMGKMQTKMSSMTMSGNADMDFAMMMREHHQGAIEMAQMELANGKDPVMKSAAKKIIASQKKEIAEFDRWMSKNSKMMGAGGMAK